MVRIYPVLLSFVILCAHCAQLKVPLALLDKPNCTPSVPINECHLFVDLTNGSDANPGTKEKPLLTIHKALQIQPASASQSSWGILKQIVVSKGSYLFNSSISAINDNSLKPIQNQSIYGGYDPAQRWKRDPAQFITHIEDTTALVTSSQCQTGCPSAILYSVPVDNNSILDGIEVQASTTGMQESNVAIFIFSPTAQPFEGPVIQNSRILAGKVVAPTVGFSAGLLVAYTSGFKLRNNTITLGSSTGPNSQVFGINIFSSSNTEVTGNTISGGVSDATVRSINIDTSTAVSVSKNTVTMGSTLTNGSAIGVYTSRSVVIDQNVISGGNSTGASPSFSGIDIQDGEVTATNNTISGCTSTAPMYYAAIQYLANPLAYEPTIRFSGNKIILDGSVYGSAYGIYLNEAYHLTPVEVSGNDIYLPDRDTSAAGIVYGIYQYVNMATNINIFRNRIYGGTGVYGTLGAIWIGDYGPGIDYVYENSIFKRATPVVTNFADSIRHDSGTLEIFNNYIEVFDSVNESTAVYSNSANGKIYNNIMIHNSTNATTSIMPLVHLRAANAILANNTMLVSDTVTSAPGFAAGVYLEAAGAQILNNIIVVRGTTLRYGMREGILMMPTAVKNNNLWDIGTAGTAYPYYDFDAGCAVLPDCSMAQMNALSAAVYSGNITIAPSFVSNGSTAYRITTTDDVNLKYGGLDLTGTIATFDIDRVGRTAANGPLATGVSGTVPTPGTPQGWSIGANEAD